MSIYFFQSLNTEILTMLRRDTIAPFPMKPRDRAPTIDQIILSEEAHDRTLCGQRGSAKERHCQLFKLTILAILPGLILIVRNAVNVAESVRVSDLDKSSICSCFYLQGM